MSMLSSGLTLFALVATGTGLAASGDDDRERTRPRVFVTESDSWSVGGELGIPDGQGDIQGGARPQTAEIVKTVHDRCPGVIVTRKEERANYILVLEHEGGKVFVRKDNKFALYDEEGDAIASGSTRSLGNAIKDACDILLDDWYGEP